MLAIFEGSVARRPHSMNKPHEKSVSALENGFLVNQFISSHPESVIVKSDASFTFAYSLKTNTILPRVQFANTDNIFCLFHGRMDDIVVLRHAYSMNETDSEASVIIRAFQVLRQLSHQTPRRVIDDISGSYISILYEAPSKFILLSGAFFGELPLYWGIDARFCLVLSDDESLVNKACRSCQRFPKGELYISCQGRTGLQALFGSPPPQFELYLTGESLGKQKLMKMILKADKDMMSESDVEKCWCPPSPGYFKINTDFATFSDGGGDHIGIGVIIRNSDGETVAATCFRVDRAQIKVPAEVVALMSGLRAAQNLKHQDQGVICESVHLNIESGTEELAHIKYLVGCIAEEWGKLSNCTLSFVSSSSAANRAAHGLAQYAQEIKTQDVEWLGETPDCISGILASECPQH
uniref:DUF3700 domain-containing protein n=1 Tax=Kalanchoe fedtschenkoi TaxID=63787 RepID=A0A7N0TFK8_KALFE